MPPPPNLLFLFPDQWRGDWTPWEEGGPPLRAPNLGRLAARGTVFPQCRANSPLCLPMRACLAQGARYGRAGVVDNRGEMDPGRDTLFKRLRDAGYRTLSCGKSDIHGHRRHFENSGWNPIMGRVGFTDAIDQRGKLNSAREPFLKPGPYVAYLRARGQMEAHMEDYRRRSESRPTSNGAAFPTPLPRRDYTDDFTGRSALELLERTPLGAPWMLWVNFPGPHNPWDAPQELLDRTAGDRFPEPVEGEPGYDHQAIRRNYAAMIAGIDDWTGWILDAVERRGETDRTLVVFASDHGEMLGDRGRWQKAVWHEPSVRVPCLVAGPGVAAGESDGRPAELIDLSATLLEAAGLEVPAHWDARSLFGEPRTWQGSALLSPGNEERQWRSACDGRWKLVAHRRRGTLLYDLKSDPDELANVAADRPEEVRRLQGFLDAAPIEEEGYAPPPRAPTET